MRCWSTPARIPPRLKIGGLREKHILRRAVRGLLPETIATRVKQPYRAPETLPFVGAAAPPWVADLLHPAAIAEGGVFEANAVQKLAAKVGRGAVGFRDNMAFLGVLTTELWRNAFLSRTAAAAVAAA